MTVTKLPFKRPQWYHITFTCLGIIQSTCIALDKDENFFPPGTVMARMKERFKSTCFILDWKEITEAQYLDMKDFYDSLDIDSL